MKTRQSTGYLQRTAGIILLSVIVYMAGVSTTPVHALNPPNDINACYDCHGSYDKATIGNSDNRPVDAAYRNITTGGFVGSHRKHMPADYTATNPTYICSPCHGVAPASLNHRDGLINFTSNINNSTPPGFYNKSTANGLVAVRFFNQTSMPVLGTCSNVNCHNDGTGTSVDSPVWGDSSAAKCSVCHAPAPATGSHESHLAVTAVACADCHNGAVESTTASSQHLNFKIDVYKTTAGDLGYPAAKDMGSAYATCSTASCHANVYGTGTSTTPVWGTPSGCSACHTVAIDATGPATGSHAKHNVTDCSQCHNGATTSATTPTLNHANGFINVTSGYPKNVAKHTENTGYTGTCSSSACHVSPYAATAITSPVWGDPKGCAACHTGAGAFSGAGPATGSHNAHMTIPNVGCGECHSGAIAGVSGGDAHTDTNIDVTNNGYPANVAKHAPGNYSSCSAASCHQSPYAYTYIITPVWGVDANCAACHSGTPGLFQADGAPATGSHASHMAIVGSACGQCHDGAVKNSSGGFSHADGSVNVSNDYQGSPVAKHTAGSGYTTCLAASCHASPYSTGFVPSPTWGVATGCVSCHTGTGAFTSYSGPATGSHTKHMALNNATCGQCHAGAVKGESGGNQHPNTFVNVTSGYTASPVTKHPIGTYAGTCANSCHTNGNGTQISSPKWGVAMPANCTGCHGGASNVTPASAILNTGKHRSHMNNYSTLGRNNNLMCAECHAKTVAMASNTALANPANHLNSFKDYSGVKAGGSSKYDTGTGVCSTVYCHSSGQATPVYLNMTGSKAWAGTARLDCSGCHGKAAGATWSVTFGAPNYPNKYDGTLATANSHEKHTLGLGSTDSTSCARCHYTTVDAGVANKMRNYSTTHLDKVRNVAYRFAFDGYSENYKSSTKTCTTYCHSNVQAPGGSGPATVYSSPAWGANGSVNCGSCHKNMASLTETTADLELGSHKRHAVDSGYECSRCHGAGYSSTGYNPSTHADGNINVVFTGDRAPGTTYSQPQNNVPADGYGTCSTSKCHGRGIRNWGVSTTLPTCEKCHGSANTALKDGVFKDTAGSPTGAYVGTHVSHLAATHKYSAPITCNQCHSVPGSIDTFGHMSSLPANIVWGPLSNHSSHNRAGANAPMTPTYSGAPTRTCNNTYCHAGVQINGAAQGSAPNPKWGDSNYLGGSGCGKCHGNPPGGTHSASNNCNACHNHVDQSNIAFSNRSAHINGKIEVTVDECLGCHSSVKACDEKTDPTCVNKELVGAHKLHTDVELFLAGKKLSSGDYADPSWIYGIKYKSGFPKFACGFCHAMDSGLHKNGLVELDLDPSHSLTGTVKNKNKTGGPWVDTYVVNSSVVCNNVYCHSNGYIDDTTKSYHFHQTPDWYATNPWGSLDRCAQCHGNSPNTGGMPGSTAHDKHTVGNHYKGVFSGYSAKMVVAGGVGSGAVHGDPNTSTTFNCNVCHFNTVRTNYNDLGSTCSACHLATGGTIPGGLKGTMKTYSSADSTGVHINGEVDVVFTEPFVLKSKAQLRNALTSVQSVYTSWTRVKGYKTYSSYDLARTKPVYNLGTCSTTACHNNTQMEWRTQGPLNCAACHTGLPQ
jgi:predicted CxxxxCH...CXXCH cytochrome family protein